jgi:hypothetical protein
VLPNTKLESLNRDKRSGLLGPFIGYEEKSGINMTSGSMFSIFHFLHNLRMGPIRQCYITRIYRPAMDKHSSLLGPSVGYDLKSVVNIPPWSIFTAFHFLCKLGWTLMSYITVDLRRLGMDDYSSLLNSSVSYEEKVL